MKIVIRKFKVIYNRISPISRTIDRVESTQTHSWSPGVLPRLRWNENIENIHRLTYSTIYTMTRIL